MNISENDAVKLFEMGNKESLIAAVSLMFLVLPFYGVWIVYFLGEVFFSRKRIHAVVCRTQSSETDRLYYRYKGEYYKHILMILILFIEPIYPLPSMLSMLPNTNSTNSSLDSDNSNLEVGVQRNCDINSLSYVLSFIFIFLLNTLTKHLINVCKSDYRIQLLPPIQHRLIILTLVLMLMAIVKLATETLGIVILEVLCSLIAIYELNDTRKNSKQLYYLLKWRYEDMRYECNLPLYRAHKRIAQKYKYLTICLLTGFLLQAIAFWLHIPVTFFYTMIEFHYPPHVLLPLVKPVNITKWIVIIIALVGSSPIFILVGVSLYYLAALCWNKTVPHGRNRIFYVIEPQVQM